MTINRTYRCEIELAATLDLLKIETDHEVLSTLLARAKALRDRLAGRVA